MEPKDRIWLPVDVPSIQEALRLVQTHKDNVGVFKLGLQVLNSAMAQVFSPDITRKQALVNLDAGRELWAMLRGTYFHDGKWDDIPTTLEGVAVATQPLHPGYVNVHASAGQKAVGIVVANKGTAKVLGVTVLTSIGPDECGSIFGDEPGKKVLDFAQMLLKQGADGIICSPQELDLLASREEFSGLFKATPSIRPDWKDYAERLGLPAPEVKADDQARPTTPTWAIEAGADAIIVGRPITKPEVGTPAQIAKLIMEDIAQAMGKRK